MKKFWRKTILPIKVGKCFGKQGFLAMFAKFSPSGNREQGSALHFTAR